MRLIIKITMEINKRTKAGKIIDGSFVIIAWIFWTDTWNGDNVKIYGRFWWIGTNIPELNNMNMRKTMLTANRTDDFSHDNPMSTPIFDISMIIGAI